MRLRANRRAEKIKLALKFETNQTVIYEEILFSF